MENTQASNITHCIKIKAIGTISKPVELLTSSKGTRWIKIHLKINTMEINQTVVIKAYGDEAIELSSNFEKDDVIEVIGVPKASSWKSSKNNSIVPEITILPTKITWLAHNSPIKQGNVTIDSSKKETIQ